MEELADDPVREQLLAAAVRVFAAKGYSGTKIHDIVREAGVSTGTVYMRFQSKDHLLREAVIAQRARFADSSLPDGMRVADLIEHLGRLSDAPLTDSEAVRLEAFVTARREADVAEAVAASQADWRATVQPLVDKAIADGTVAADVDPEAVLHLVRTLHLGLLVQRGASLPSPDPKGWSDLIHRIVASFGNPSPGDTQ